MLGIKSLNRLLHKAPNTFVDALVENGVINQAEANQLQGRSNSDVERILVGNKRADAEKIAKIYGTYYNFPFVKISGTKIEPEVLRLIPESVAQAYRVIAFELKGDVLKLAVGEPSRLQSQAPEVIQELNKIKGVAISIFITTSADVDWALGLYKNNQMSEEKLRQYGSALSIDQTGKVTKSGLPYIDLMTIDIPYDILAKFPREVSEKYKMVVFGTEPPANVSPVPKKIKLALLDAANPQVRDILEFIKKRNNIEIQEYECSKEGLAKSLAGYDQKSDKKADIKTVETKKEENESKDIKPDDVKSDSHVDNLEQDKGKVDEKKDEAVSEKKDENAEIKKNDVNIGVFKPSLPQANVPQGVSSGEQKPVMQGPKMVVLGGGARRDEEPLHSTENENSSKPDPLMGVATIKPKSEEKAEEEKPKDDILQVHDTNKTDNNIKDEHEKNEIQKENIKPVEEIKKDIPNSMISAKPVEDKAEDKVDDKAEEKEPEDKKPEIENISKSGVEKPEENKTDINIAPKPESQPDLKVRETMVQNNVPKVQPVSAGTVDAKPSSMFIKTGSEQYKDDEKNELKIPDAKASPQQKLNEMKSIAGTVMKPADERLKEGMAQPYSQINMKPVMPQAQKMQLSDKAPEIKAEDIQVQENMVMPEEDMGGGQNLEESNLDKFLTKPVNSLADLERVVKVGMIPEIVASVISLAVGLEVSDIHIEAGENNVRIRYRMDGMLRDVIKLPLPFHAPLVSRIKILAKLKIDEQRVPQDGRFNVDVRNHDIDLRISTLPTVHGEKVVMRILDKSTGVLTLEDLGITGNAFDTLVKNIVKPYGIVLATGPTGSGKSTSLYAVLQRISLPNVNVITLEDPVEYEIPGINQAQVKPQIGFTFAEGLRSVLRQDPNVIMVGEIRDLETASMATHAALTGHLVLSTLHTNDAAGALPRLINMGVEPFLITSSINCIIAQRLVRKICQECKEPETLPPALLEDIKEELSKLKDAKIAEAEAQELIFYKGKGCSSCTNGYHSRIGIYEVLAMSDKIEELAVDKSPATAIGQQAIKEGMVTMKQDGILKALKGITTMDEVLRVTTSD